MTELELFQIYHLKEMSLSAELFLSCSLLQLTFYAIGTTYQRKHGYVLLSQQIYNIGILIIGLTTLLLLNEDLLIFNSLSSNNFIINDYLSFVSKVVVCLTSILFFVIVKISYKDELIQNNFEYVVLVTISVLGLLLLCSSNDLITAYLAIELQSVAFYIMSAFKKNSSYSIESGLKYFIIGSLSSAFFLFGSSLIYGCLGSLNFDDFKMFFSLFFVTSSISSTADVPEVYLDKLTPAMLILHEFSRVDYALHQLFKGRMLTVTDMIMDMYDPEFYMNKLFIPIQLVDQMYLQPFAGIRRDVFFYSKYFYDFNIDTVIFDTDKDVTATKYVTETVHRNSTNIEEHGFLFYILSFVDDTSFMRIPPICEASIYSLSSFIPKTLRETVYLYSYFPMINKGIIYDTMFKTLYQSHDYKHYIIDDFLIMDLDQKIKSATMLNSIPNISSPALNLDLIFIGFMLIFISIFIKLAVAPFHLWSLDVYEGSPNTTTFFFAVVPKIGLFVLLLRLYYSSCYHLLASNHQLYFFVFAVLSIFVGSIGGLEQRKLKSLLAYSSISHTGYLLLSFSTSTSEGMQMMLYYLVIFMIAGLCFWSVYLFTRQRRTSYFNKYNKELGDLVLLKDSNPMLAFILAITLFSIAGIPPIAGFLAKVGIFLVVIKSSAYLISVISILLSVASTFYYLRVIKILYFENVLIGKLYFPVSTKKALVIAILSLLLLILCIDPMIIYLLFHKAILLINS